MIELFITAILIVFFGLFVMMALPIKDEPDMPSEKSKRTSES
ncbi:MAG: hypothetical protein WBC91_26650 [Phototrophicaceae bacterium]